MKGVVVIFIVTAIGLCLFPGCSGGEANIRKRPVDLVLNFKTARNLFWIDERDKPDMLNNIADHDSARCWCNNIMVEYYCNGEKNILDLNPVNPYPYSEN